MESEVMHRVMTPKGEVTYHRYSLAPDEPVLPDLVKLYQDVFADPPWNECLKCTACERKFSRQWAFVREDRFGHSRDCDRCEVEGTVVPFWSDEVVVGDFRGVLLGRNASCYLARCGTEVIGFTYGREYGAEELAHELKLPATAAALLRGYGTEARYAYQDEIAVASAYRQLGVAKELFRLRQKDFEANGLTVGVTRTQTRPQTVTFSWYTRMQYAIVAAYGDDGARVILAQRLSDVQITPFVARARGIEE